jgi:hypothetical protein
MVLWITFVIHFLMDDSCMLLSIYGRNPRNDVRTVQNYLSCSGCPMNM